MEKRAFLALAVSLLILLSWNSFISKTHPIGAQGVTATQVLIQDAPAPAISVSAQNSEPLPISQWQHGQVVLDYTETRGAIQEVIFKDYRDYKFLLGSGLVIDEPDMRFKKDASSAAGVISFTAVDSVKRITKKLSAAGAPFEWWLDINIVNLSKDTLKIDLPLILGVLDFAPVNPDARYLNAVFSAGEKATHLNGRKDVTSSNVGFIGLSGRYFCSIVQPSAGDNTGFIKKLNAQQSQVGLILKDISIPSGQEYAQKLHIYLGPQELQLINNINPDWSKIVNYGTFDIISQGLLWLLRFVYGLVHNWGLAIIILSLLIYLLLFPLQIKQMRSMREMQVLQPKIEALRKQYSDNPQRLNKEIMELYRIHKVNPLGGCLPLVLQMPIFFALYQALMRSVALRGANFLWIKDLSEPDKLALPFTLPFLGNSINILPLVMAIGMFVQQRFSTPASASGSSEQRMMLIIFPVIFGVIFYNMPAGLVLYWLINSVLMLIYQIKMSRAR
jgi:YidC/Oxa1 family membrane protein insertase